MTKLVKIATVFLTLWLFVMLPLAILGAFLHNLTGSGGFLVLPFFACGPFAGLAILAYNVL